MNVLGSYAIVITAPTPSDPNNLSSAALFHASHISPNFSHPAPTSPAPSARTVPPRHTTPPESLPMVPTDSLFTEFPFPRHQCQRCGFEGLSRSRKVSAHGGLSNLPRELGGMMGPCEGSEVGGTCLVSTSSFQGTRRNISSASPKGRGTDAGGVVHV